MKSIELVEPLKRGWQRMIAQLFRPFDLGTWFVVGFTAWLATLGQNGGSSGNLNLPSNQSADPSRALSFVHEHVAVIVLAAGVVFALFLLLSLVLAWLSARGRFMFLHNVVRGRAEVKVPWRAYRREGNSLFIWLLVFGLCVLLASLLILGLGTAIAWPSIAARTFGGSAVLAIVISVLLFIPFGIAVGFVMMLLDNFVVPVMFIGRLRTQEAWRAFSPLLRARFWDFALYGLFKFALGIGLGMVLLLAILATCCTLGCLLAIPYLNAVIMLPVHVTLRAFSLEYLRQFGEDYDAFAVPPLLHAEAHLP